MFFFIRKEVLAVSLIDEIILRLIAQLDESQKMLLINYIKARFEVE